jgi:hypothetical protein
MPRLGWVVFCVGYAIYMGAGLHFRVYHSVALTGIFVLAGYVWGSMCVKLWR